MHVVVIVLGDVGRSPRMQYHCQSLLECGHSVTLVGYAGEELIPSLVEQLQQVTTTPGRPSRLRVVRFAVPDLTVVRSYGGGAVYFLIRTIVLSLYLLYALVRQVSHHQPAVDFVLVQNPPALPLLFIALCYCRLQAFFWQRGRRPGLIIDWHNLGFSMLPNGTMVRRLAEECERKLAPLADGHLTVTKAMQDYLKRDLHITNDNVDVLYDQPPLLFQPLDVAAQHELLTPLTGMLCFQTGPGSSWTQSLGPEQTLLTEVVLADSPQQSEVRHRPGRPALVTSSTSWTADEDFGMLLDALVTLDRRIADNNDKNDLRILVLVTGKGPERGRYEEQMSRLVLGHIAIATVWLAPADYPRLLACADLGVSLHTSTSGLDLPMKILDLFGCATPVVARDFPCLSELVQDGTNGRVFTTATELANALYELLTPLPSSPSSSSVPNHAYGDLHTYSQRLQERPLRWHENWMDHAFPVLMKSSPMN
jgi:beta-1,4-mannosyltransferase